MNTIISILLMTLGIVGLAYSGVSFTTPGNPMEPMGLQIVTTAHHFVPPVAGLLAVGGGTLLLLLTARKAR